MNAQNIMELAKANNDVYLTAYREGLKAGADVRSRLKGAIEDYLDGEMQGNVSGLRQALSFASKAETGAKHGT